MEKNTPQVNVDIVPYGDDLVEAHRDFCSKVWPGKKRRREDDSADGNSGGRRKAMLKDSCSRSQVRKFLDSSDLFLLQLF